MLRPAQRSPLNSRSATDAAAHPPARPGGGLVRHLIGLVLASPVLKRLALRVALRYPALLQRFKSRIKDAMAPPEAHQAAPSAPPPSSPATVLGPRFKTMILDELQRLDAPANKETGRCG